MNKQEAFKIGFLARCIEDGCDTTEINRRVKIASELMQKQANLLGLGAAGAAGAAGAGYSAVEGMKELARNAPGAVTALAVAPWAIGGLGAYMNHISQEQADEMPDGGSFALEEAKNVELADEYKRMTNQLAQQKRIRDYKQQRKRTGQVFL